MLQGTVAPTPLMYPLKQMTLKPASHVYVAGAIMVHGVAQLAEVSQWHVAAHPESMLNPESHEYVYALAAGHGVLQSLPQ